MTIELLVCAASLSFVLGILFGVLTSKAFRVPILSRMSESITFVLRAIPFFVQLLIVYFVLPDILDLNLDPFTASILALGICSSGYVAQIIRGGVNAIPIAQWESSFCLGFSRLQSFFFFILPQTLRNVLPMINNEFEALLKSTSIVSSIGMLELTRVGMNIISREMKPVATYLTVAAFYLFLSTLLGLTTKYIEKRFTYVKNY